LNEEVHAGAVTNVGDTQLLAGLYTCTVENCNWDQALHEPGRLCPGNQRNTTAQHRRLTALLAGSIQTAITGNTRLDYL